MAEDKSPIFYVPHKNAPTHQQTQTPMILLCISLLWFIVVQCCVLCDLCLHVHE